ncbi:MAG: metal ABC transporter substrate-binding protein [Dehalococcoidia bacterium]
MTPILRPTLAVAAVLAIAFAGCTTDDGAGGDRLTVVTTLPVFQDIVGRIGGERADVSALFPAGSDPHTYEPAPRDVAGLARADIVISNGLHLEGGSTTDLIDANLKDEADHVRLGEKAVEAGVTVLELNEGGRIEDDPHLWLSVDNARLYLQAIRDALIDADPGGTENYQTNYDAYMAELDGLDGYVSDALAAVPADRRSLVTTHDAFGYMAEYMGFEVLAFVAESPGQEPSVQDVAHLGEEIEGSGVPAVFEEPQLGAETSVLRQAASDVGAEVCTLYSDSLDDDVATYIDLIRFNADELARCLG